MRLLDTYIDDGTYVWGVVWQQDPKDNTTYSCEGDQVLRASLPQDYTRADLRSAFSCDGDWPSQ